MYLLYYIAKSTVLLKNTFLYTQSNAYLLGGNAFKILLLSNEKLTINLYLVKLVKFSNFKLSIFPTLAKF